ncbi:MAG: Gfo/Idh/MocA family oxidoreductase [Actinobacteria bacterium]|nr:Gfo/Idh/MocA family oxidoreductase [Actinomycetota bacterium]
MVKIGFIGAGYIAQAHASAYKQIKNVQMYAVTDKVEQTGMKFAEEHNIKYLNDTDEIFKDKEIDLIDICVPTFLHKEMVLKATAAKKNLFCEKPLALSLDDADVMIKAVNDSGVKAIVGHVLRFWPEYVKVKEYIDSNVLGKPMHAFCQRLAVTPDWHQNDWGASEKLGGGAALDLHIHDLDYLVWLFGKPSIVMAQGIFDPLKKESGGLVHIATTIEFENKVSALVEGGWEFKGAFPFTMALRILCEGGTLEWIFRAGKNIEERSQAAEIKVYKNDGSVEILEAEKEDAFHAELSYFIDCIENNKPVKIATFEDGRSSLELALAAIKSAKTHSVINL